MSQAIRSARRFRVFLEETVHSYPRTTCWVIVMASLPIWTARR